MFYGCYSLKILDISNFNTMNIYAQGNMFYGISDELKKEIKDKNKNLSIEAFMSPE